MQSGREPMQADPSARPSSGVDEQHTAVRSVSHQHREITHVLGNQTSTIDSRHVQDGGVIAACELGRSGDGDHVVQWSQRKLADEMHYHRTAISHLEAGRYPAPRDFWEGADRLLAAGGALPKRYDELVTAKRDYAADTAHEPVDNAEGDSVLAAPWNHRGTVRGGVALHCGGRAVLKRGRFALLAGAALTVPAHQWLIREPEPLVSGLSSGRISMTLAEQLPVMITTLRRMDDAAGGGTVLSLAQHAFDWVAGLLDQASYDEPTGRRLHAALAELGQLAGWVALAGQPGLGQRYHVAALHAAHSADDRVLGAHILGCMVDQAARRGRAAEAVTLIESAMVGIRGRETSDPPWLYWVTPAEITAGAGDCLLQLGQPAQATMLLDEGIGMFDESFARDRQVYLTHLADALSRPGKQRDLDAAADRGLAAVRLAEGLASTRGTDCLRDLYTRMRPHAPVPAIRTFLERARAVLAT